MSAVYKKKIDATVAETAPRFIEGAAKKLRESSQVAIVKCLKLLEYRFAVYPRVFVAMARMRVQLECLRG
jgi:hypothetical protein